MYQQHQETTDEQDHQNKKGKLSSSSSLEEHFEKHNQIERAASSGNIRAQSSRSQQRSHRDQDGEAKSTNSQFSSSTASVNTEREIRKKSASTSSLNIPTTPQTSVSSDIMRRRTKKDPLSYYPSNEGIANTANVDGYGYFSSPPRTREVGDDEDYDSSPDDSPNGHPTIADFMPADQQYTAFLKTENANFNAESRNLRSFKVHHAQNLNPNSFWSQPANLQLSKFATIFSLIATIILFMFGLIIEIQPLYIKGISPTRTPLTRNLNGHYSHYSFVHFSARLRILQNTTLAHSNTNHEEMARMLEDMTFEMKSEAKVAFKAAALYFLIMVFSIIYTNNHVLIHSNLHSMHLWTRFKSLVYSLPRNLALLIRKYRRRHYSNVQEVNSAHDNMQVPGIGLARVRISNRTIPRSTPQRRGPSPASSSIHTSDDYDSSSGREDLGLSMRERPRRFDGNEQGNSGMGFASSAWESMIVDKTKKG